MPSVTPSLVTHAFARVRPVGALWRLRGYLKPYRTQMIVMFAAALGAVTAEIVIPLLTKAVIDGAIAHHDKSLLIPLALAAIGLGASEGLLNMIRRWIQAGAVANIEKSIRDDLYAHLQRLQASFHDDWQSGQLLSRATTDLSSIRRFAGFGLIFLVTNIMTFLAVVALLIHLNWWLGLITGVVFAPVLPVCFRFEKRYRVLSRRVQDQQGDLATLIEEAATGVRVLKALGRGRQAAARHDAQAAEVCQTQVEKAGLLGSFWALLDLIPNAVIGLIIVLGAIAVSTALADPRRPGGVHHAGAAARLAGRGHGLHHRVGPGGGDRGPAGAGDLRHRAGDHRQEFSRTGRGARPGAGPGAAPGGAGAPAATWCSTTSPSPIRGRPSRCSATSCST